MPVMYQPALSVAHPPLSLHNYPIYKFAYPANTFQPAPPESLITEVAETDMLTVQLLEKFKNMINSQKKKLCKTKFFMILKLISFFRETTRPLLSSSENPNLNILSIIDKYPIGGIIRFFTRPYLRAAVESEPS